jgi:hypothetical protein
MLSRDGRWPAQIGVLVVLPDWLSEEFRRILKLEG